MLFQKLRPFAFAFFLLLMCGTLALAQPANPPLTDEQANAAAGGAIVFVCVCWAIAVAVGLAIQIAILVFVYKDAKARGTEPMLWLILVFFTGLIGLIIWLIVRPPIGGAPPPV